MSIYNYKFLLQTEILPQSLLPWINHQTSLTDKLQTLKPNAQLKRLSQAWRKPTWWDKYGLQIQSSSLFQREILMISNQVAYWYARTLIPHECYIQNAAFFNRLEQEPLKNLIFDNNEVQRLNRIVYPIDKTCIEYYWVKQYLAKQHETLWARLSEYAYHQHVFYLIELLFPELGEISA